LHNRNLIVILGIELYFIASLNKTEMNLSLQDMLAILGPIGTLIGFMWRHFNNLGNDLRGELKNLRGELNTLRGELNGVEKRLDEKISSVERGLGEKIDAARDRISRIEGQLVPAKIIAFEEVRPKEITEQRNAIKHA
jgi:hypothetical protein